MIVYLVRHGETTWNQEGRYQGQRESPLTPTGLEQARAVGTALERRRVRRVISSPLVRCVDTARPLATWLKLPIEIAPELIEIAHGSWEGRLRSDLARDDSERMRLWREHPERVQFAGGESLADVMTRWRAFADRLSGNDEVAVITHDVLVRCAVLDATDRPLSRLWEPRVVNGGYARFSVENGVWTLLDECVDVHLGSLVVDTTRQAL